MKDVLMKRHSRKRLVRASGWICLSVFLAIAVALVIIPVWITYPFRRQTPQGLELAYRLLDWSPLITLIIAAFALIAALWLWRGTGRRLSKAVIAVSLLFVLAATWLARVNYVEWIFKPLLDPAYAALNEASFINDEDAIIAIEVNGDVVAYPVRQISYHHIVQDIAGGVPVAVTY